MDKIEVREGRVWLPKGGKTIAQKTNEVDGIKLPAGSYLLSRDWTSVFKTILNPFRVSTLKADADAHSLMVPNYYNWSNDVFESVLRYILPENLAGSASKKVCFL